MSDWDEKTAEWYAEKYGEHATNRLGVARLALMPDSTILDVGCGTAAALREAATTVVSGRLIGVDPVPRMLEIARERCAADSRGGGIELVLASAERLPFGRAEFDFVLAFDSIDHWRDQDAGLAEIARVLKHDGLFAVVKDGGIPGSSTFRDNVVALTEPNGLHEVSCEYLVEGEVKFAFCLFKKAISMRVRTCRRSS